MANKYLLLAATANLVYFVTGSVWAGTTFLPDWQNADLEFKRDEPLCSTAVDLNGNLLYHKADGCPKPKILMNIAPMTIVIFLNVTAQHTINISVFHHIVAMKE